VGQGDAPKVTHQARYPPKPTPDSNPGPLKPQFRTQTHLTESSHMTLDHPQDLLAAPDLTDLAVCRQMVRDRQAVLAKLSIKHDRVSNLACLLDPALLHVAGMKLKARAAAGIDRVKPLTYRQHLGRNINKLIEEVKHKTYQPSPARRVSIPKDDGSNRHLGLPTTRDKHLQRAVLILLEAIYEPVFHDHSYGFRPRRSAKMAMQVFKTWMAANGGAWVLEIDLSKFFDTIDHHQLLDVLQAKIGDRTILKLIKLWLKAGVMVDGVVEPTERGTPQGGVISPLAANAFLDSVLDQWLTKVYFPGLHGQAIHVRYADDFVIAFQDEDECRKALIDITARLEDYGLTVNQKKSKLTDMRIPGPGSSTLTGAVVDFLGFTYYWKPCPETGWELRVRTSDKSIKRFKDRISTWMATPDMDQEYLESMLEKKVKGHRKYFEADGNDLGAYLDPGIVLRSGSGLPPVSPSSLPLPGIVPRCPTADHAMRTHEVVPSSVQPASRHMAVLAVQAVPNVASFDFGTGGGGNSAGCSQEATHLKSNRLLFLTPAPGHLVNST